ncbi:MAG: acyltransferase [Eubacteriales bacterium]|nr:acyltransferase [Eubacteriales bacterium]
MKYIKKGLSILLLVLRSVLIKGFHLSVFHSNIAPGTEFVIRDNGSIKGILNTQGRVSVLVTGGKLKIGSLFLNRYSVIACHNRIEIGKHCTFGSSVMLYDHDHKFDKTGMCNGYSMGEIIIGDNVWIGANCVILKNTHIGNNCVIGAGCVVRGDIPDNSLVTMERSLKVVPLRKK